MKSHIINILAVAVLLFVASCGGNATAIKDLMADPASYDGKTVQVRGEVKSNVGALGLGAYQLDDGTGTIMVVTTSGGAPREGAKVDCQGKFRSGFTLGDQSAAVIMEESRKLR
jgi:hypothetical protein